VAILQLLTISSYSRRISCIKLHIY